MKKIVVVAGEVSGDFHAGKLVTELKNKIPGLEVSAMGGAYLREAGAYVAQDIKELSVVGIFEVLKNIKVIKAAFKKMLTLIESQKPDAVIFVDYPGFNLRLAKKVKELGIKTIYYVSPQVWAWGKKRIFTIKNTIDHMIVFFDFEKTMYEKQGMEVFWAGHPLLDTAKPSGTKQEIKERMGIENTVLTLGFFPGSRPSEVKVLLPVMKDVIRLCSLFYKDKAQYLVQKSPIIPRDFYDEMLSGLNNVKIVDSTMYDSLAVSDFALVCSGTATLEAAIIGTPMLIVYKVSKISWLLFRRFVKVNLIGLCNLVVKKEVAPERLQEKVNAKDLAQEIIILLHEKRSIEKMKKDFQIIKEKLGLPGASERAADYIVKQL